MLNLSNPLIEICDEYTGEVREAMEEAAKEAAKETVKYLRANSPKSDGKKGGSYRRGWAWKTSRTRNGVAFIVHNKTDYQLTHLLEKGHRIFINGKYIGRSTNPIPHIAPAEQKGKELYIELVERKLGK